MTKRFTTRDRNINVKKELAQLRTRSIWNWTRNERSADFRAHTYNSVVNLSISFFSGDSYSLLGINAGCKSDEIS